MTERMKPAWELEVEARVVNATDWEPLPGMVKRLCDWCRYFFAAPATNHEPRCPDCVRAGRTAVITTGDTEASPVQAALRSNWLSASASST